MPEPETVRPVYREVTRHIKELLDNEIILTGIYANLCRPNKRGGSNTPVEHWKARPNILARRPDMAQNGRRNLQIGELEVMVLILAPLFDEKDHLSGFDCDQSPKPLRYVIGTAIQEKLEAASFTFHSIFRTGLFDLREPLKNADYPTFVSQYANVVNYAMSEFKKECPRWK